MQHIQGKITAQNGDQQVSLNVDSSLVTLARVLPDYPRETALDLLKAAFALDLSFFQQFNMSSVSYAISTLFTDESPNAEAELMYVLQPVLDDPTKFNSLAGEITAIEYIPLICMRNIFIRQVISAPARYALTESVTWRLAAERHIPPDQIIPYILDILKYIEQCDSVRIYNLRQLITKLITFCFNMPKSDVSDQIQQTILLNEIIMSFLSRDNYWDYGSLQNENNVILYYGYSNEMLEAISENPDRFHIVNFKNSSRGFGSVMTVEQSLRFLTRYFERCIRTEAERIIYGVSFLQHMLKRHVVKKIGAAFRVYAVNEVVRRHILYDLYAFDLFLRDAAYGVRERCIREFSDNNELFNYFVKRLSILKSLSDYLANAIRQRITMKPQECLVLFNQGNVLPSCAEFITADAAILFLQNYVAGYFANPEAPAMDERIFDFLIAVSSRAKYAELARLFRGIVASKRIAVIDSQIFGLLTVILPRLQLPELIEFSEALFQDDALGELYIYEYDLLLNIARSFPGYTRQLVASHEACMARHAINSSASLLCQSITRYDYSAALMWQRAGARLAFLENFVKIRHSLPDQLNFGSPASTYFIYELIQHGLEPNLPSGVLNITCLEYFASCKPSRSRTEAIVELMCLGAGINPIRPIKDGQAAMIPVLITLYKAMPSLVDYVCRHNLPKVNILDYSNIISLNGKLNFRLQIAIRRPHHLARNIFLNLCLYLALGNSKLDISFDILMLILRPIGLDKPHHACRALLDACYANSETIREMSKTPGGINVSECIISEGEKNYRRFTFFKSALILSADYENLTDKCKAADLSRKAKTKLPYQPSPDTVRALGIFRASYAESCLASHMNASGAAQKRILQRMLQDSDLYQTAFASTTGFSTLTPAK